MPEDCSLAVSHLRSRANPRRVIRVSAEIRMSCPSQTHLLWNHVPVAFNDRFRFSVHAAVVDDASQSVLLLRQSYGDRRWGLPGGAVEPGETIVAALERECREELGVEVEIGPLTGWYYHREFEAQVGIFRCELPVGAKIDLSDEHSAFRWTPVRELGGVQAARVQAAIDYAGTIHSQVF